MCLKLLVVDRRDRNLRYFNYSSFRQLTSTYGYLNRVRERKWWTRNYNKLAIEALSLAPIAVCKNMRLRNKGKVFICRMLWGSRMLDPGLQPHQCLLANIWIKQLDDHAGQQVLYHRWTWGIHYAQVMNHTSKGIHNGFETQARHHHKSKQTKSVSLEKWLMSSNFLKKFLLAALVLIVVHTI